MCEGRLQYGCRGVHPDEITVDHFGVGHQCFRVQFVDAYLRRFTKENVGGVNVHAHIRTEHILEHLRGDKFRGRGILRAGENAVHIQIEHRNAARDCVHAERIERGIDIDNAAQQMLVFVDPAHQLIAYILPLQLVAVRAGDDADPFGVRRDTAVRLDPIFDNLQPLIDRKTDGYHLLNHKLSSLLFEL